MIFWNQENFQAGAVLELCMSTPLFPASYPDSLLRTQT